jgi:hypothetical protein
MDKKKEITKKNENINGEDPRFNHIIQGVDLNKAHDEIEESRKTFFATHNKIMKTNRIVGICFIVIMLAVIVLSYVIPSLTLVLFIAVAVFFVGILLFTRFARKKMDQAVGLYLTTYSSYSDSYLYDGEPFSDILYGFKVKPDAQVMAKMDFKNELFHIGSRDLVKGKMNGRTFEVADVSYKTGKPKDKKTHKTVFVGKVINLPYKNSSTGRTLCYLKGCGDAEPDKLADVNMVEIKGLDTKWKVYSSCSGCNSIFNHQLVTALNQFNCDEMLNDIIISIESEQILIGLSYSDSYMIIPMEKEFDANGISHYKNDLMIVGKIEQALSENNYFTR